MAIDGSSMVNIYKRVLAKNVYLSYLLNPFFLDVNILDRESIFPGSILCLQGIQRDNHGNTRALV